MSAMKKSLDKDALFQKILPALEENPFSVLQGEPVEPIPADELSALHNKLFARTDQFKPNSTATINVMETLVLQQLDAVIRKFNVCGCDRCRCDIAACALNLLPPRYIVSHNTRMEQVLSEIDNKEVTDALIKAVIKVRSYPRH